MLHAFCGFLCRHLGNLVSKEVIRPDPEKVNEPQFKSFCGFVSYRSLDCILLYNVVFFVSRMYNCTCRSAFQEIVDQISMLLRFPDDNNSFGLLTHETTSHQDKGLVAFYNHLLNDSELNYSATEGEFLALINTFGARV